MLGHLKGAARVRLVVEACASLEIKALTLYTFSTENWKRPKREINALMKLLKDNLLKHRPLLKKNNIRFNTIGNIQKFPEEVRKSLSRLKQETMANDGLILTLALNYGSRSEILTAAKRIATDAMAGKINPEMLTEELFDNYLYTKDLPPLDLLIRTSGEMRLSNFLLWQLSYSEIYVTKKFWPDFTKEDLQEAVADFTKRQRRFGAAAPAD